MNPVKKFFVEQIGKIVRSGGETTADYPGLAEARREVCNGCTHMGKVGLKNSPVSVDGCTICRCPLLTKTKTLTHRDYRNKIDWRLKNLPEVLDKDNVPFVRTQCDLGKWEGVDYEFLGYEKIMRLDMAVVESIGDYGKKRSNPDACPTNSLRLDNEQCGCTNDPTCEDTATIAAAAGKTILSYKLDGVEHTVYPVSFKHEKSVSAPADDTDAVCDGLYGLVRVYETKVFVTATLDDGGNLLLRHIGACKLESVKVTDGTTESTITFTRKCTLAEVCTLAGDVPPPESPATTLELVVTDGDGNATTTTMDDADYSDTANSAALEAEILAALPSGSTVKVTVGISGAYGVEAEMPKGYSITLGGRDFANCGCREQFIA